MNATDRDNPAVRANTRAMKTWRSTGAPDYSASGAVSSSFEENGLLDQIMLPSSVPRERRPHAGAVDVGRKRGAD
jgi:hypothetical protein